MKEILKNCLVSIVSAIVVALLLALFLKSLVKVTIIFNQLPFLIILLPLVGVIISYVYQKYGANANLGTELIVESYRNNTNLPEQIIVFAPIATIISHLFGASIGREGIGVQVSSAVFSYFSKVFNLSRKNKQILLLSGVSAGFGIIFQTPLSGMVFGYEFFKKEKRSLSSLLYSFIASYIGVGIIRLLNVKHQTYSVFKIPTINYETILCLVTIGICTGLGAIFYIKLTRYIKSNYEYYFNNKYIRVFIAGLIIVLFVVIIQTTKYQGLGLNLIDSAFNQEAIWYDGILKLISTSLSVGGGFFGGEITPLFASGASIGSIVAVWFVLPASYGASLGYISLFASVAHAPLTGVVLGVELFGVLGLPFYIIVCIIAYLVNRRQSIYNNC